MNCCAECFGDRHLKRNIIPNHSSEVGECSYCLSKNVAILPPAKLAEHFELLMGAYQLDTQGKILVAWFREDWAIFEHPRMDDAHAKDLLSDILDDGEIVRQPFLPVDVQANRLTEWNKLRDELRYKNRFFPESNIDLNRLESLLSSLKLDSDEVPTTWYRARIQNEDEPFDISKMGAPPGRIASYGRANPAGIPYLYLASTPETAVSEVRPHTGQILCVADFVTPNDLQVVDLRSPRRMISPFIFPDANEIGKMRNDLPFLEQLGEELTRPVLPESAAIDYTPSQYLCEFIKKCGYDGVIYRSSVSAGMNLALFDTSRAVGRTVSRHRVTSVMVKTAES
jgi:RES domain